MKKSKYLILLVIATVFFSSYLFSPSKYVQGAEKKTKAEWDKESIELVSKPNSEGELHKNPFITIPADTNATQLKEATEIADSIKNVTLDDMLKDFGGRKLTEVNQGDAGAGKKYDEMQLEDSFEDLQANRLDFAKKLVVKFPKSSTSEIEQCLKVLMLDATYLHRWYDIKINQTNLWEIMFFEGNSLQNDPTHTWSVDQLVGFSEELKVDKALYSEKVNETFMKSKSFSAMEGKGYKGLIEWFVSKYADTKDYTKWFRDYFTGSIYVDKQMKDDENVGSWNKALQNYLPYLLTMKNTADVVIFETTRETIFTSKSLYEDNAALESVLKGDASVIKNYFGVIARTKENGVAEINRFGEQLVFDKGNKDILNPDSGLNHELYLPIKQFHMYDSSAAVTIGNPGPIIFTGYKMDSYTTLGHELTHALDYVTDAGSEFFSTYQNHSHDTAAVLNLFYNNNDDWTALSNHSPSRFQTKTDIQDYASNYENLNAVLNTAIADVILALPIEQQAQYLYQTKANLDVDKGIWTEAITSQNHGLHLLSKEEIKKLNLHSIHDLVRNGIIIASPGTAPRDNDLYGTFLNSYGTSLLYADFYLTAGKPYNHNQGIINKLYALDGWEGFQTYNQLAKQYSKTDNTGGYLQALKETFHSKDLTFASLLEDQYTKNQAQAKKEGLALDSYSAIQSEAKDDLDNIMGFKKRFITRYLSATKEFRTSIFDKKRVKVVQVDSYKKLVDTIVENPNQNIELSKNISFDPLYAKNDLTFSGTLDGKGHFISGQTCSLFKNLSRATIKNLVLINVAVKPSNNEGGGALSQTATNTTITNVHAQTGQILANEGNVGGLVGTMTTSSINGCSAKLQLSGDFVGGLVGQQFAGKVNNSYSGGEIQNSSTSNRIGGLVGNPRQQAIISNSYTSTKLSVRGSGIFGTSYSGGVKIFNTLSMANVLVENYKFTTAFDTSTETYSNNFEDETTTGVSSTTTTNWSSDYLKPMTKANKQDPNFYQNVLEWDTKNTWDVSKAGNSEYPFLKNDDPGNENTEYKIKVNYIYNSTGKTYKTETYKGKYGTDYTIIPNPNNVPKGYWAHTYKGDLTSTFIKLNQDVIIGLDKSEVAKQVKHTSFKTKFIRNDQPLWSNIPRADKATRISKDTAKYKGKKVSIIEKATTGGKYTYYKFAIDGKTIGWTDRVSFEVQPITVNYVNSKRKEIAQSEAIEGELGKSYEAKPKAIAGYWNKVSPSNRKGKFDKRAHTVIFKYDTSETAKHVKKLNKLAKISKSSEAIWSNVPRATRAIRLADNANAYKGKTVKVVQQATTGGKYTYYKFQIGGKTTGWMDKSAFKIK